MDNQPIPLTDPLSGLTLKEKAFVKLYCQYRNGTRAAKEAGYSVKCASETAYDNLQKPSIQAAISAYVSEMAMGVDEAVSRMGQWGRGNIDHFLNQNGELDLTSDEALAHRHLIKKVKQKKTVRKIAEGVTEEETYTEIELYDAKDAVDKVLQLHGRYKQLPGDAGGNRPAATYTLPDGTVLTFS